MAFVADLLLFLQGVGVVSPEEGISNLFATEVGTREERSDNLLRPGTNETICSCLWRGTDFSIWVGGEG